MDILTDFKKGKKVELRGNQTRMGPLNKSDQGRDHHIITVGPPYKSYLIITPPVFIYFITYTPHGVLGFWGTDHGLKSKTQVPLDQILKAFTKEKITVHSD